MTTQFAADFLAATLDGPHPDPRPTCDTARDRS